MPNANFSATARRTGILSAVAVVVLLAIYAVTLIAGLISLKSPGDPIGDPMFTILEIVIIAVMPAMVVLMSAVHAWAPPSEQPLTLVALIFMGLLAGLTCSVHFVILTLGRHPAFAGESWLPLFLSFKWPSVVYALDILGWDFFFAMSMLFAAPAFGGTRLTAFIRWLMIAGGAFSVAGLSGVATGDMQLRNIGIIGYVPLFLITSALLAVLFYRDVPE